MITKQTFCSRCAGLKHLFVDGKHVPPRDWMKHGMASDIGCWCPPRRKEKVVKA